MYKRLSVNNIEKYNKDLKQYQAACNKITNPKVVKVVQKLIDDFQEQVRLINDGHSTEYNGYIRPDMLKENIDNLVRLRVKLNKIVKDVS